MRTHTLLLTLILSAAPLLAQSGVTAPASTVKAKPRPTAAVSTTASTADTGDVDETRSTSTRTVSTAPTAAEVAAAGGMALGSMLCVAVCVLLGLAVYVIPSIIAFGRGHPNAGAICAVNLLLGWLFVGWVVALVWSFTAIDVDRRYR